MKKIFLVCFCFLMLFGCQKKQSPESRQFEYYDEIKERIMQQTMFESESPDFQIKVIFQEIDQEYRYDVIIDHPQTLMSSIKAMAYANEDDEHMCPTIGVFDDHIMNLKKDYIDKEKGYYKGVQLSGMVSQIQPVKVYISYNDQNNENKEIFIEVSEK